MTDGQRAAARDLFKEGDALQRSGKLAEALDRFQRAQAVFDAPTNLVRIAECQAALGRLVESAEAFRAVLRAELPAGSPAAFHAAADQARAELSQVEPRIPKIVVDVQPAKLVGAAGLQLQIDGQAFSAALVGAPMPLDPGSHRVAASAPGYAPAEQTVVLKEQDSRTVSLSLKASTSASTSTSTSTSTPTPTPTSTTDAVPPPPPVVEAAPLPPTRPNRPALLLGAHLGWDFPGGKVPINSSGGSVDIHELGGSGPLLGVDGAVRFARQWIGGLMLEHAELGSGTHGGGLPATVTNASSNTTSLTALIGLVLNPDRPSFYGHVGLAARWYSVKVEGASSPPVYTSGEAVLAAGIWLPSGRSLRLLPEATLNLGTFSPPTQDGTTSSSQNQGNQGNQGHVFFMLGVAGFFSAEL